MHIPLFFVLGFFLSTCTPAPLNPSIPLPRWTITAFSAYISPTLSYASFKYTSTNVGDTLVLHCAIEPSTAPIYLPTKTSCGEKKELWFRLSENEVVLQRTWMVKPGQWVTGIASQGTYWVEEGRNGNVTNVEGGEMHTRTAEWEFPIQTIIG
ncbi:hypothetical protein K458DRAFT_489400 [Lentithecium fluviatile CBS 122367]|uniref:AA1-like domain-containing protein n=1 Tax=Lentithecium fluviatile CBS 122367 TaxID=1168545 RepID=A0A6G1IT31_9PLEO|nr:hypothetical protein K458DRAFT_489400 [Lentithecium fluviatile CBS 122367]